MHALILGGNGFIGTHLSRRLAERGTKVTVLDRGPVRPELAVASIASYIEHDWSDEASLRAVLQDVDVVYHLISTTVPSTGDADPSADVLGNLLGTLRLAKEMERAKVRRIVFLSSGGTVYGNPETLPVPESHACNPISSYGIVKFAIERYLEAFRRRGSLDPLVIRAANPYGPLQDNASGQGVVAAFLRSALAGEPLSIWGDGMQVRDYVYIEDLVAFIAIATEKEATGTFNVGSGAGRNLLELVDTLSHVLGRPVEVNFKPGREFDVRELVLDISRARTLGWTPGTTLAEGFERTLAWMVNMAGAMPQAKILDQRGRPDGG